MLQIIDQDLLHKLHIIWLITKLFNPHLLIDTIQYLYSYINSCKAIKLAKAVLWKIIEIRVSLLKNYRFCSSSGNYLHLVYLNLVYIFQMLHALVFGELIR